MQHSSRQPFRHQAWLLSVIVWACIIHSTQATTTKEEIARLYLNSPGQWPEYQRGKGNYKFVLNDRALKRAIHVPQTERLRVVMDKLSRGEKIVISTIGGSITAGQGAVDGPAWPKYLQNYMEDHYPGQVSLSNGAVGGIMSTYMALCMNVHVPKNADIVFIEFNQNDWYEVPFKHGMRTSFERMVRKLLTLPNQPAVVLMNSYSWTWGGMEKAAGVFWRTAEKDYNEFALFYGLPSLSVKGAVYHLMAANVTGFNTRPRMEDSANLRQVSFNWDPIHPDAQTGSRCMFELAARLLIDASDSLTSKPLSDSDRMAASAPLPPPMIPNNYPSISDRCFIGNYFSSITTKRQGFDWRNDAKQGPLKKYGMIANKPGAVLEISVDSRAMAQSNTEGQKDDKVGQVQVELAYLASYERMGKANVTCVQGCRCEPSILNGHTTHRHSQLEMHSFYATQSDKCIIRITVLNDTDSEGHKVKVAGIVLSEESGNQNVPGGISAGTVSYVHDISMRSQESMFDITNHIRRLLRQLQGIGGRRHGP